MLQTIRDHAQGWIAWAIVLLISVPFALWGIESYLGFSGEPVAASVNGIEIPARDLDRRLQQARVELRERLGPAYDPAAFDDKRLRDEVLGDMIRDALLLDVSKRLGLRVSDLEIQTQILAEPAFQRDGRFDRESYARILQLQGMSPAMFEAQLRQQMTGTQLVRAVVASEFTTSAEWAQYRRLSDQKREVAFARFPLAQGAATAPVDEAAISAYYDANTARFQTPEQVKLDYILLDASALAAKTSIGEEELRKSYDADPARFRQPERRKVSHLLLTLPQEADEATTNQVLAEIKTIRARIEAGEPFAELAKTLSKDPGSAAKGGSLGAVERGVMDPAFEQTAFGLPAGQLSEPVRTAFGFHLIKVDEIIPAQVKPFEEVRDQIRTELAKQRADASFYELSERLSTLVYESPDSLEPAAEQLGLTIQHSDWIGRNGGEGVLGQPKVTSAAFSDEVLTQGHNSDMIEPERDRLQAIVLRVVDHRPAATRPLAEVHDQIADELRKEQARAAAAEAAKTVADKLRQGGDWIATLGAVKPEEPGLIDRHGTSVPAPVRDVAFKLPIPSGAAPSIGTTVLDDGTAVVVRVTRVQDGEVKTDQSGPAVPEESGMLSQFMGRQIYSEMVSDMASRAKIERKQVRAEESP